MSKRYAPEHKALVLRMLDVFKGDILITARFCQIPERTLRDWHTQRQRAARQNAARQNPTAGRSPSPSRTPLHPPVTIQVVRRHAPSAPPQTPPPAPGAPRRRQ